MSAPRDHGVITAFVTVVAITPIACAALAIDGARNVSVYVQAADHAENAARVGAQEITGLRSGELRVDVARATAAATAYLAEHDLVGHVAASSTTVTVTVSIVAPTLLLHVVGLDTVHASATRSAEPVRA